MKRLIDWLGHIVLDKSKAGNACFDSATRQFFKTKELEERIYTQEGAISFLKMEVKELLETNNQILKRIITLEDGLYNLGNSYAEFLSLDREQNQNFNARLRNLEAKLSEYESIEASVEAISNREAEYFNLDGEYYQ